MDYCHAESGLRMANQVLGGSPSDLLYSLFPMNRLVMDFSKSVAVHNIYLKRVIQEEHPNLLIHCIAMPVDYVGSDDDSVRKARKELEIRADQKLFVCLGLMTRSKGIETVLKLLKNLKNEGSDFTCIMAGSASESYPLADKVMEYGLGSSIRISGYVSEDLFQKIIAASDFVFNFRFPTARESSAVLFQAMSAGKPVFIHDLYQFSEIPDHACIKIKTGADEVERIKEKLDLIRKDLSIAEEIGCNAGEYIRTNHSPEKAGADLMELIDQTLRTGNWDFPRNDPGLPEHIRDLKTVVVEDFAGAVHNLKLDGTSSHFIDDLDKMLDRLGMG